MKQPAFTLLLSGLFAFTPFAKVSVKDFKPVFGSWKGSLTYRDYGSGQPFTMPANLTISGDKSNTRQVILAFSYPQEPKANGNDTLVISKDGSKIDGAMIMSKEKAMGKEVKIITEKAGIDGNDNRKALIRHTYLMSPTYFSSRKEVKFEDDNNFILRSEFTMRR